MTEHRRLVAREGVPGRGKSVRRRQAKHATKLQPLATSPTAARFTAPEREAALNQSQPQKCGEAAARGLKHAATERRRSYTEVKVIEAPCPFSKSGQVRSCAHKSRSRRCVRHVCIRGADWSCEQHSQSGDKMAINAAATHVRWVRMVRRQQRKFIRR